MTHDFWEKLHESESVAGLDAIMDTIAAGIPASTGWRKATTQEDKSGTDYWIDRSNLPAISVDLKNRTFCPIAKYNSDDACIETTSVYSGGSRPPWLDEHRRKAGWTVDYRKRTDLVVYTWPTNSQSLRYWVLYFPHLCFAARKHWRQWAKEYGERPAFNDNYVTLNTYPPRNVIASAMRSLVCGQT